LTAGNRSPTFGGLHVVLCQFSASSANAQVLYGSLVGNVTDDTGAAVPGATVIITQAQTQVKREMVSDENGAYRFQTIQPGTYRVAVAMPGFGSFNRDVEVTPNNVTRVDVPLKVGQLTEAVTVEASTPILQTDRAEVRSQLSSRELQELPVPVGRNYQNLFKVLPGFTPPENAHSVPSNPSRALVFNVNGASRQSNNTRIDGVSTTNIWLPHVVAYVPALESIETVNVVSNSFDAEQGLAGGAAISVQIKSGTNQFRGSAFEYHTNEALRANNYFAPPGTSKGKWRYHQYGATLGGPVKRNKLFFFASYEGTRDLQNLSRTESVPTEALRRGDLSASANPIYDPMTGNANGTGRTAFPGNIIPADRIHPTVASLIQHLPLPNLRNADGSIREQNNYFVQAPFVFNRWTLDTKVNYNATAKLSFFGRYSVLDFNQNSATVFGEFLQGRSIGDSNAGIGWGKTHNLSGGATYSFTSNLVLDAHLGFVQMNANVEHTDIDLMQGRDLLGLPGTNGPNRYEGGMPRFAPSGYSVLGVESAVMPYYRSDDQVQNVVNLNWAKGRHNIRLGTDLYYQAMNHIQPEGGLGARGGFTFGGGPTQLNGGPSGNNFNGWGSFLLGLPTAVGRLKEVDAPYTTRNWQYSMYIRDQWQPTSKLTISLGTRWEYFPLPTRADRGIERYNPLTNMVEVGGVGSVPKDLGVEMSKTLFAPRVGMAYRITPKTVVRAGFGITNDPYSLARPHRTNHPVALELLIEAPNSFGWARPLSAGIPEIPDPDLGDGIIPVPSAVLARALPDKFERGHIKSWNAAFQRELVWGFVAEAAYVATRQVDQLGFRELNWSPVGGGQSGRQLFQQFGRTASTLITTAIGDSKYDSLQTRLDRRFANGVQFGINYTYSRNLGIAGAPNSDGTARIQIPEYYHLNYGRSDIDRPHALNITSIVQLPFGPEGRWLNNGGVLSAIVGGWQTNNIISYFSGSPFSVTSSGTSLNAPASDQRADLVVDNPRILGGIGTGNAYFDPEAFRPVTEARFGTAPWNVLRGPGFWSWDFGLFREVTLPGQKTLQIRFEGFNMLNTPRFNNPGANASNLQRNPDGSIRNLNGFAEITGTATGSERQMRLGLRLGF
jgi:hypothetical protein